MAETIRVTCDRCGARVSPEARTRVKWSKVPERRDPTDLCLDCRESLDAWVASPPNPPRSGGRR